MDDEEWRYDDSDYEDYSAENYDSEDWGASDPDEPSLIPGGYTVEEMVPEMKRLLKDTVNALNIPQAAAVMLLREHKWSKDLLFEKFYDDPINVEQKYGVYYRCNPVKVTSKAKNVCEVCYDVDQPMMAMPCGHELCRDCWRAFCEHTVSEGPSCVQKSCPEAKCKEILTKEEFQQVAPHLLRTYESYEFQSFIESNRLTCWCPGPGCDRIVLVSSEFMMEQCAKIAKCDSCCTQFCFLCGEEPHTPCDCKEAAAWNNKVKSEQEVACDCKEAAAWNIKVKSEQEVACDCNEAATWNIKEKSEQEVATSNKECDSEEKSRTWILENTKPCPKCASRIEKNEGCEHMTCQKCRHEFCWICLEVWYNGEANTLGHSKCNKFVPEAKEAKRDPKSHYIHYYERFHIYSRAQSLVEKAKRDPKSRYLYYYERFCIHSQGQAIAETQLKETESKMLKLQESFDGTRLPDVDFLKTTNELLIECRRVLKYTYAFGYYLTDESRMNFEYQQEILEKLTETLSELSALPLDEMNRLLVIDQTHLAVVFMKKFLQFIDNDLEMTP